MQGFYRVLGPSETSFKVLSDISDQTREGSSTDEEIRALLVAADLS